LLDLHPIIAAARVHPERRFGCRQQLSPITVTVDVSSGAGTPQNNTVSISGGNELNASNDSAIDPVNHHRRPTDRHQLHQETSAKGKLGQPTFFSFLNNGAAPSVGTVTLIDTLPAGLTATSMSGTGWNCTLAP